MASEGKKLWGGRFSGETDPLFEKFNASIGVDKAMWLQDIRGSQAYAKALAKAAVITDQERDALIEGLEQVGQEWKDGTLTLVASDEDIHTANERRLGEIVGDVAGKLHTGRSRNDQVATDLRMWLIEQSQVIHASMLSLIKACCNRAQEDIDVLMPGFTHLQPAQPIRWSHFVLSHAFAWRRDTQRLNDLLPRVARLPLGSGAVAGNPFNIDRMFLAQELKFQGGLCCNSIDAVSDRDFVAEFLFFASMTMTHLSQWAEDLIIFCSKRMVTCADAYSTGSSLMPQKKNPDALELLRGKSARVVGALTAIVTLLKSLPRAYNKDLQEDKELLFDAVRTLFSAIPIAEGVLTTLKVHPDKMKEQLVPEMLATDIAEYLVRKGVPFRETHHIAGGAVALAESKNVPLSELTLEQFQSLHPLFEDDILELFHSSGSGYEKSVDSKDTFGGTARSSVLKQIEVLDSWLLEQGYTAE